MSTSPSPAAAANTAAEAVRALNHLTLGSLSPGRPDWRHLGDVYVVVANLRVLAERLPQAFDQLARVLDEPGRRFRTDNESDPADAAATAGRALLSASGLATDIARSLARAHEAISHLVDADADADAE